MPFRLQLTMLLCLPLLSTACATPSTPPPATRTDRPAPPALSTKLTRTETLKPLSAKPSGQLVKIDKGMLAELYERLAEAIAAVTRGNTRAVGVRLNRSCTEALFRTGVAPVDCRRLASQPSSGAAT